MNVAIDLTLIFAEAAGCDGAAEMMRPCPHVVCLTAEDRVLKLRFVLPETKKGWAVALARQPELIGAVAGRVETMPDLPEGGQPQVIKADAPPCGSDCVMCPHYLVRCGGCPATPLFRPGYIFA